MGHPLWPICKGSWVWLRVVAVVLKQRPITCQVVAMPNRQLKYDAQFQRWLLLQPTIPASKCSLLPHRCKTLAVSGVCRLPRQTHTRIRVRV